MVAMWTGRWWSSVRCCGGSAPCVAILLVVLSLYTSTVHCEQLISNDQHLYQDYLANLIPDGDGGAIANARARHSLETQALWSENNGLQSRNKLDGAARHARSTDENVGYEEEDDDEDAGDEGTHMSPLPQGREGSLGARAPSGSFRSRRQRNGYLAARIVDAEPACDSLHSGQLWYASLGKQLRVCDGRSWRCTHQEKCTLESVEQGPVLARGHTSAFTSFLVPGKRGKPIPYILLTQNSGDIVQQPGDVTEEDGDVIMPGGGAITQSRMSGGNPSLNESMPHDPHEAKLLKVIRDGSGGVERLALRQTLTLGRVKATAMFSVGGKMMLASLSMHGQDLNVISDTDTVTILQWTGKRFRRRKPQQDLHTPRQGAVSIDTFTARGHVYLIVVGTATGGRYGTWMTVYKWVGERRGGFRVAFDRDYSEGREVYRIMADASHVRHFAINGYDFVAVSTVFDGSTTHTDSHLFLVTVTCSQLLDCLVLRPRQRLPTIGAMSSAYFSFRTSHYLAFASSASSNGSDSSALNNLDTFRVPSIIYKLSYTTQKFEEYQRLPTMAADRMAFFSVCDNLYVFVSSRLPESVLREITSSGARTRARNEHVRDQSRTAIFRWRGIEKFQPWMRVPLTRRTWSIGVLGSSQGDSAGSQFLVESSMDENNVPSSSLLELQSSAGADCGGQVTF
eukprot:scpid55417/ scgid25720/ Protein TSPEAR; Thrombospondin-type laminin G domain and EAR repeat-containing protein